MKRWSWLAVLPSLLILFLGWWFVLEPGWIAVRKLQSEEKQLLSFADSTNWFSARLDSVRDFRREFALWGEELQRLAGIPVPDADSVAALARGLDLTVGDMEVSEPIAAGQSSFRQLRMVVSGHPVRLARFLDSLQNASPRVRLERLNWSRQGGVFSLRPLELRIWSFDRERIPSRAPEILSLFQSMQNHAVLSSGNHRDWIRLFGSVRTEERPAVAVRAPAEPSVHLPQLALSGFVAGRLANAVDTRGNRVLLRPGDKVDGWNVLEIRQRSVVLERDGRSHEIMGR